MKVYLGFDDTDDHASPYGTGKLVRWFQSAMPAACECRGVVRQQLLVADGIPYTSHNSAACLIAVLPDPGPIGELTRKAADHLVRHAAPGSDPGLCVVTENAVCLAGLVSFGYRCTREVVVQADALAAASDAHLEGLGGTNDGIIGAAAAVGLTASGWSGRFIEFANLRSMPADLPVSELRSRGIEVLSVERDAPVPAPDDSVATNGWLRPRLVGHRPVLFVDHLGPGRWRNIYRKRRKNSDNNDESSGPLSAPSAFPGGD